MNRKFSEPIFFREPSYDLNCVTLQKDGDKPTFTWNWVTHNCSDMKNLYPICEYPYFASNFSINLNEGNINFLLITKIFVLGFIKSKMDNRIYLFLCNIS